MHPSSQAAQPSPESSRRPPTTSTAVMTPREQALWAMSFDELFKHARRHNFGKGKSESQKSGRVTILKWILKKEGLTPYVAARVAADGATDESAGPRRRNRNGAMDHPEAILQTSDPALQRQIEEAKLGYLGWTGEDLVALAMQRSYQIFKDSMGKMPTRARPALTQWLAAWDVLKSPREKRWWLGDGIDLVNKAKAMGYDGSSTKKYDVIVWLRTTPEDAEAWTAHVAEPTANRPLKRAAAAGASAPISKRPAKGSHRPGGWKRGFQDLLDK